MSLRDTESEYWSAWRIKWLPRFAALVVLVGLLGIANCWNDDRLIAWPRRVQQMAATCHGRLAHSATLADTNGIRVELVMEPYGGAKVDCVTWMALAGEKHP